MKSEKLTKEDLQLIHQPEWILQKNRILEKVEAQLYELADQIQSEKSFQETMQQFPELKSIPKVNRGEQLRGLPYRLLDFPVYFQKENTLAFRTLFWWGQKIRVILHVKGKYLETLTEVFLQKLRVEKGLKIRYAGKEWDYSFEDAPGKCPSLSELNFMQLWFEIEFNHPLTLREKLLDSHLLLHRIPGAAQKM